MRILIIDDHVLFRAGLISLLESQPDLTVIGSAGSVSEAIHMVPQLKPDLVLMDFTLPDGTGLDATTAILDEMPETNILFLTMHDDDDRLFAAVRSGAKGYLLKNVPVVELFAFIRGIAQGKAAISPDMTSRILEEFAQTQPSSRPATGELSKLTARELEVLVQLDKGATNREIAERLVISERTVKNHVSNILTKLNLKNRLEAANYARHHGLLN